MADREPCHAGHVTVRQDVHPLQIIVDDPVPLVVGEDALARLDGQRAVPDTVPAMVLVRIVSAPPVAWIRVVLAFPDMVATVEPFPDPLIRCVRTPVEIERVEQIRAACDEVLVGVLVVPASAEQVFHESRRIEATADLRNHIPILDRKPTADETRCLQ